MKRSRRRLVPALVLAILAVSAVVAYAQRRGQDVPFCYAPDECPRTPYDGRFTFVRVYFDVGGGGFGRFRGRGEPAWHHDRPEAERNLSAILREISSVRTFDGPTGGNVFALDDPEIFRYPVIWMAEAGEWRPSDEEVESLRAYLLKGGFMIVDDFSGDRDWYNFESQMRRVLPGLVVQELDGSEPIFHSFFDIDPSQLRLRSSQRARNRPYYLGIFEENDRTQRQIVMINYNNDIGEYMEYNEVGLVPVDLSNEAYKLGVNFMIYAMTH